MRSRSESQNIVFLGGGHSHAIVLRQWQMHSLANTRLTLLSDTKKAPYSGMLPAHVAGLYSYEQTHIDLPHLAQLAQAKFYEDKAIGLDLERKQILCLNRPPLPFDTVSIDIGSTPATFTVSGAKDYAVPAKPVPVFLRHWYEFLQQVETTPNQPRTLAIVGGGAGGVELALNMQQRLQQNSDQVAIHLFQREPELLPRHGKWIRRHLHNLLRQRGVTLHLGEAVREVLPDKVICESGLSLETDIVFWVTQASAPDWIEKSGLATDERGFILVNQYLQSVSHPFVFAAGDIAAIQGHPRPKAGVFAVRQGKPLFRNLQRTVLGKPLKPYRPQRFYLSLIGTGDQSAIASWGPLGFHSPLLWRWKDHIDRKFMAQFPH
ncbi:MAG: FAD-dependent oxidoreductase [Cyanobacteria bacterium SW_9_44_58]|nr:MAG: FAD-dependent oxidoreductase [Cyanobacteria bacterium SW_9_44_58]